MARLLFFIIFGFLFLQLSYGQDKLSGRVFENKTRIPLSGIKIEDLKTHVTVLSDSSGRFSILAKIGDNLSFSGFAYKPDTVYISNLRYTEFFMEQRQNMLKEVRVLTPEIKTGSLTAPAEKGPFDSQTVLYQTFKGNYSGGVKIMVWDSHSDEKQRQKDIKLASDEEMNQQIAMVFSPRNIQNYLPLKGQELANFIILYNPDIKTYVSSSFNFLLYLDACYKKFLKIPADERQSATYFQLVKNNN